MEFDYPEIYAPIDLGIGKCRLAVAEPAEMAGSDDPRRWSHVRIATKYPEVTRKHFAEKVFPAMDWLRDGLQRQVSWLDRIAARGKSYLGQTTPQADRPSPGRPSRAGR